MRFNLVSGLFATLILSTTVSELRAQPPVGRSPDLYENVTKITKASEEEQKKGILATITIKGSDVIVQITKETQLPISKGKLEEKGTLDDLKVGDRVSVWYMGKVEKSDPARATAYMVMIFRGGQPKPIP
jgi:Protein of unknown function (DUF3221)